MRFRCFSTVGLAFCLTVTPPVFGAPTAEPVGLNQSTTLPNGWRITPAGKLIALPGDMPVKIVGAPDKRSVLVVTAGFHDHLIAVIDPYETAIRQHVLLGKAWAGLAVDPADGGIFISGGGPVTEDLRNDLKEGPPRDFIPGELGLRTLAAGAVAGLSSPVLRMNWQADELKFQPPLKIEGLGEADRFIAGLAVDQRRHLFAVNAQNDTIYEIDLASGKTLASAKLGFRPFQVAVSPDGNIVAVTNMGDASVSLLTSTDLRERVRVTVGAHPSDLAFASDGRLFVANASANSVSVIRDGHVVETISTSIRPGDLVGATPNSLAIAADGSRLYVANADNNDIAVVDIRDSDSSRVLGFIPTGWYPSATALTPDENQLVVGVAKGVGSRPSWPGLLGAERTVWAGPDVAGRAERDSPLSYDFVARIMTGYAEVIPLPTDAQLAAYSRQVRSNVPVGDRAITATEKAQASSAFRHIKHVVYIIKENHAYDDELGDDPRGDGLKDLVLFGRDVTPNAHALVEKTPLLDRYFLNGDVSYDGHYWANAAYSTVYNERTIGSYYSDRGIPDPDLKTLEDDQKLLESPAGYLWDSVRRAGLSYYSYGEFNGEKDLVRGANIFVSDRTVAKHANPDWGNIESKIDDVARANIFIKDLEAANKTGKWPNYTVMSLPWDHTWAVDPRKPTPRAAVADNDLALGMIVEAVSRSRFWKSTAIFVTQDDPGGLPDHVDAHRSVGMVISPYVRQHFVDHTRYTMTSMIRTMELILGLRPMTQFDRSATPMYRLFQPHPSNWTYSAIPETVDITATNPATGQHASASQKLDFAAVDRNSSEDFSAILWDALKPGVAMPAPIHGASENEETLEPDH